MGSIKTFECFTAGCQNKVEFDLKELIREKEVDLNCSKCNRDWALTLDGSSCCKVYVRIVSNSGNSTIVKVKSYSKR